MTSTRTRLIVLKGAGAPDAEMIGALRKTYEVVEVEDIDSARALIAESPDLPTLCLISQAGALSRASVPRGTLSILQHIGEGVGVIDPSGDLIWASSKFKRQPREIREQFVELGREAYEWFRRLGPEQNGERDQIGQRQQFGFDFGQKTFELEVTPVAAEAGDGAPEIAAIIGVLWDVTANRQLQNKLDAIDAAGSELMKIESATIAKMNMAERLKWLEEKIVHYVHELLNFDNFEIRLLNKETKQLELVIAVGLAPLKIGEAMYADREGNGISGYVAVTGESYICPDTRDDPLYREGLDNARSALTVPLFLHDQVIGVFNAESYTANVFDENDRRFAEIFGRYVAIAMNILDLMVVERYTTNEQLADNVIRELNDPLHDLSDRIDSLTNREDLPKEVRAEITALREVAENMRNRVVSCAQGPRTILGAEQELRRHEIDPQLQGKRVIVADDEATIRETISSILSQKGCDVIICATGGETIKEIERESEPFDLVISDIRMPDRNGYEVFRAAKAKCEETPVILMTGFGYDPHHSIVRSSQEGLSTFLFKPFQASQLVEAVGAALHPETETESSAEPGSSKDARN
ncbi:MAG: response regulator [Phycisphaerales bacterium]|nr:MAG: response regulator [Phycisphaerales bacterium]